MLMVAYKINDTLVRNYENDSGNCSGIILIGVTTALIGINLYWIVKQFMDFSCGYSVAIMTVTVVGIFLMYALVFIRSRSDASILTSAIASSYCLYLQWSSLSSDSDSGCNSLLALKSNVILQIVFGLIITMISLIIISGSTKS
jgi:hypothetical protein